MTLKHLPKLWTELSGNRQWNRPSDIPGPVCWLRQTNGTIIEAMVLAASDVGVTCATNEINLAEWSSPGWSTIEHSTDRINWFPCTVPRENGIAHPTEEVGI